MAASGYFLRDETISCSEMVTIIGGFCGVLILINPEMFDKIKSSEVILEKRNKLEIKIYP